ncbi:MAG: flagellar basal-body rod protein FlgF [candidate division Zixibacteria bacterium]|nr:flagellar basal-body rod protein FlgF [candidate division Zixibacteria bacterium]
MRKQEAIANNLANSVTAGFKRDRVFFQDLSKAQAKLMKGEADWQLPPQAVGAIDFKQGTLEHTGHALDLALAGEGFFAVSTPDGERYTRNGHFDISPTGVLTTSDGNPVLGTNGPIQMPPGDISVSGAGVVSVNGRNVGNLRVVNFADTNVLIRAGSALLGVNDPSVKPVEGPTLAVRQGYLEGSNVSTIEEMVDMITTYRFFETDQKAIQIQDETLAKAVNEIGRVPG